MTKPVEDDKAWHLDKKVPVALIVMLMVQTAGAIWWASGINERVSILEKADESRANQSSQLTNIAVDIATLKEKAESTNIQISDIKRSVENLSQQMLQQKAQR